MLFATYLAQQDLSYAAIQVYLSANMYSCNTTLHLIAPKLHFERHVQLPTNQENDLRNYGAGTQEARATTSINN